MPVLEPVEIELYHFNAYGIPCVIKPEIFFFLYKIILTESTALVIFM